MKKPSQYDKNWDDLRQQIIGLGEGSHSKNYYPALKQSRDALIRFRAVIEEIPDMILIADENGAILDLNKAAELVFSRSRSEMLDMNADDLLEGRFEELKRGSSDTEGNEPIIETPGADGESVVREVDVRPVKISQKSLWVVIGRDVSHRIRAEQKLIEINDHLEDLVQERTASIEEQMAILKDTRDQLIISEKMAVLGTMVAGVAHEINNPLGIGLTASSALVSKVNALKASHKEGNLTEEEFIDFLDYISQSASLVQTNLERAGELIKSFKQVSVDQSSEQSREIELLGYLEEVVQSLYPQWKRHIVNIGGLRGIRTVTVPGDWSQILTNLIINSVVHGFKGWKSGGIVSISVTTEGDRVHLDYSDNGCGLTDQQADKIFDPFYTTARENGGTGLGMHIVYNIITLRLEGDIRYIRSEDPGVLFRISVPLNRLQN